jgi:hypothetical protein
MKIHIWLVRNGLWNEDIGIWCNGAARDSACFLNEVKMQVAETEERKPQAGRANSEHILSQSGQNAF